MPNTVLITLGRLPKGLDIARSFHRAGFRVIVAESFGWHLMRVSRAVARSYRVTAPNVDRERYLDDLKSLIEAEQVSIVVPVSEETMYVAALRDRLPPDVRVYGLPRTGCLPCMIKVASSSLLPSSTSPCLRRTGLAMLEPTGLPRSTITS